MDELSELMEEENASWKVLNGIWDVILSMHSKGVISTCWKGCSNGHVKISHECAKWTRMHVSSSSWQSFHGHFHMIMPNRQRVQVAAKPSPIHMIMRKWCFLYKMLTLAPKYEPDQNHDRPALDQPVRCGF